MESSVFVQRTDNRHLRGALLAFVLIFAAGLCRAEDGALSSAWTRDLAAAMVAAKTAVPMKLGPWKRTDALPCATLTSEIPVPRDYDAKAKDATGKAVWSDARDVIDQRLNYLTWSLDEPSAAYLYRQITVPRDTDGNLYFGTAEGIVVWFNGEKVLEHDVDRQPAIGQEKVAVRLRAGDNRLVVKLYRAKQLRRPGCQFYAALSDTDHAAMVLERNHPVQSDWLDTDDDDRIGSTARLLWPAGADVARKVLARTADRIAALDPTLAAELRAADATGPAWLAAYERAHRLLRRNLLQPLLDRTKALIFAKHHVFGSNSNIYIITETERTQTPSALCRLDLGPELEGRFATCTTMIEAEQGGTIRDPELSTDGKRLLFAWRSPRTPELKDYQIFEQDLATGVRRQLTDAKTYGSSFEPCYLPDGGILFSSSRIVQNITCGGGTDHSNLFIMDKDGKYARRIGFDQTNTGFPSVLEDGRVIYTRRDYNDRGQSAAHALFQMNPDGTNQTELYGNQTGTPNSFQHARGIPGTKKILCVIGGYHTTQGGKLAVMDVAQGRELASGLIQIPDGVPPASGDKPDDNYGKQGIQYSNPYPVTANEFIVSRSEWHRGGYRLFLMAMDGRRELLTTDPATSCLQGIPVMDRPEPLKRARLADYTKDHGVCYVQDVYLGVGSEGIARGSIKKLRVVEVLYKPASIGAVRGFGPGGGVHSVLPIGHPLAAFDAKRILGEVEVHADGSVMFKIPPRTPVYFQLLDAKNRVLQTMRSWTTLMPGENFSCVGCHEDKNSTPSLSQRTQAMKAGPQDIVPFYGPPRPFSFLKEVQPVLDRHCVSCHNPTGKAPKLVLSAEPAVNDTEAKRRWPLSYFNLTLPRPGPDPASFGTISEPWARRGKALPDEPNRNITWWTRFELMKAHPPCRAGAIASGMVRLLEKGHHDVKLPAEAWDKLCAWIDLNIPCCGEYDELNTWTGPEREGYRQRVEQRRRNERIDEANIKAYVDAGQP